uniref:(northern house mosquito) hypothetical protein n=1 Tax=Culex pipiens TaxID=7175 RepID=A0A8D8CPT0_CULPI
MPRHQIPGGDRGAAVRGARLVRRPQAGHEEDPPRLARVSGRVGVPAPFVRGGRLSTRVVHLHLRRRLELGHFALRPRWFAERPADRRRRHVSVRYGRELRRVHVGHYVQLSGEREV